VLNIPLRRAYVTAFWIVVTSTLTVVFAVLAALRGWSLAWAAAGAFPMLPRLVDPLWFETAVRGWNAIVRRASVPLRGYILRVSYFVLFTATASSGNSLEIDWTLSSKWHDRERLRPAPWLTALMPSLWLLWMLRDGSDQVAAPSGTSYTLY